MFVVNKADRKGVVATVRDLNQMLDLGKERPWRPPVLATVAVKDEGTAELWDAIAIHRSYLETSGELSVARRQRLRDDLEGALAVAARRRALDEAEGARYQEIVAEVEARRLDPWTAATMLIEDGSTHP